MLRTCRVVGTQDGPKVLNGNLDRFSELPAFGPLVKPNRVPRSKLHDLIQAEPKELAFHLQKVRLQHRRKCNSEIACAVLPDIGGIKPARYQIEEGTRLFVEMMWDNQRLLLQALRQVAQLAVKMVLIQAGQIGEFT